MKRRLKSITAAAVCVGMLASCGADAATDSEKSEGTTLQLIEQELLAFPETGEPQRLFPENTIITSAEPTSACGALVETDSAFRLKTAEDYDEASLCALLSTQPARDLTLTKNAPCEYTLECGELPKGEIVKLLLGDGRGNTVYSWAFQVKDEFRALSAFPADKSEDVFTNSGIEVNLSYPADLSRVSGYFEITPPTSGRFVNYSSTLAFVPDKPLEAKTVYRATLKKGLPSVDGSVLEDDFSFSFRTSSDNGATYCYAVNGVSETYLTDDPAVIEVTHSNAFISPEPVRFEFTLYGYESAEDYRRALQDSIDSGAEWDGEYTASTEGLITICEGVEELQHSEAPDDYYYDRDFYGETSYFVLPDGLAAGWYLADYRTELDGKEYVVQRLIQISDISVYAAVLPSQALFFVNDAATGRTAENADITLYTDTSSYKGKTDGDGTALLDISSKSTGYGILEIRTGDSVYYDRICCAAGRELSPSEKYQMYMYADRSAYLPNDTIKVWGVIRPRRPDTELPENLFLMLGTPEDGEAKSVTLSEDGTFTVSFDIKNCVDDWFRPVSLTDGKNTLCCIYVSVRDYQKPLYIIEPVVPDYVWLPQEESFTAGVYVRYFDGTPAPGKSLILDYTETVVTDENGYAEYTPTNFGSLYDGYSAYSYQAFTCQLTGIENQSQFAGASYGAFLRDAQIDCVSKEFGETSSAEFEAYEIDISGAEMKQYTPYADFSYTALDMDSVKGEPYTVTAEAQLTRYWWEAEERGTYYDFIQKKTVQRYTYNQRNSVVGNYTIEIKDGKGKIEGLPTSDDGRYTLTLQYRDKSGRKMYNTVSFGVYERKENSVHNYSLFSETDYQACAGCGDDVEFTLRDNYESVRRISGRILYAVHQDTVLKTGVSDRSEFSVRMEEEYIPSAYVTGAYFDGKHVYGIRSYTITFDTQERGILLDISTDKESYSPSDTAQVTITARYNDGKPVQNARILLSTVDCAALAAATRNYVAPLSNLYPVIRYPQALTFCSYREHSLSGAGTFSGDDGNPVTGGGEDRGAIRSEFLDTAYFAEGLSDSSGSLTVPVKLPDNITSWALSAAAVADNNGRLYAGGTRVNRAVTLPVFLNAIMLDEYVEGDDIVFSASCSGADNAVITAEVTGENYSKTLTADKNREFNFGKLPVGEYTVLYRAESTAGSDALQLPFAVKSSRLTAIAVKSFSLDTEKIDIKPEAYPVTLTFVNEDAALYCETVNSLLKNYGGNTDYSLARSFAQYERGWTDEEHFAFEVRSALSEKGLASVYTFAESDMELTALICAAFPDYIEKKYVASRIRSAFRYHESTDDNAASCYFALAALGEPVLGEITAMLDDGGALSLGARLKLCAGLALLGDEDRALRYYKELTGDMTLYRAVNGKIYAYVKEEKTAGGDDAIQGVTRFALVAAAALRLPEAEGMARWLNEQKHREYGCALERAAFLRLYKPSVNTKAKISYTIGGDEQEITLDSFCGNTFFFGEEQFLNADFKVLSGSVTCTASYEGKASELEGTDAIKIVKTIEPLDGEEDKPGSLYAVKVTVTGASGNTCDVEDIIPSCFRFAAVPSEHEREDRYSVYHKSGQRVTLSLYKNTEAVYYVYRVLNGESAIEGAIARDSEGNYGAAEKGVY